MIPPRLPTLALCAALTAAAMVHWSTLSLSGDVGWSDLVRHPAEHDGERVVLSLFRVIAVDGARATVRRGALDLDVVDAPTLTAGAEVTVEGTFDADARVVRASAVYRHPARAAKRWLGVAAVLAVAIGVPLTVRRTPAGLRLRR